MDAFLNEIYQIAAVAFAGILVKFVVSLIKLGLSFINEKIDSIKNDNLKAYCKELMEAAETMTEQLVTGPDRKQWVIEKLVDYADEKDIPISENHLSILIQAIFKELDGVTLNTDKKNN